MGVTHRGVTHRGGHTPRGGVQRGWDQGGGRGPPAPGFRCRERPLPRSGAVAMGTGAAWRAQAKAQAQAQAQARAQAQAGCPQGSAGVQAQAQAQARAQAQAQAGCRPAGERGGGGRIRRRAGGSGPQRRPAGSGRCVPGSCTAPGQRVEPRALPARVRASAGRQGLLHPGHALCPVCPANGAFALKPPEDGALQSGLRNGCILGGPGCICAWVLLQLVKLLQPGRPAPSSLGVAATAAEQDASRL